jgi:hypothetical protein
LSAAILRAKAFSEEEKEKIAERSFAQVSRMSLSKNLQAFYSALLFDPSEVSEPTEAELESKGTSTEPLSEEA